MESAAYERHPYSIYPNRDIPVSYHRDHVGEGDLATVRMHWHENPEFLRFRGGSGWVLVAAGKYACVPEGIVVVNPNDPHTFFGSTAQGMTYDCMIVDAAFCRENGLDLNTLRFETGIRDATACALYDKAYAACAAEGPLQVLAARAAILEFLLYLCRSHRATTENRLSVSGMEALKKAVLHIRNNYRRPISLQEAADAAGFSVSYFSREFKKLTGQTFVSFLNRVRCQHAAQLLRSGMPVTEACYASGFRELSYFSRTFRQIMGMPPSEIRRQESGGAAPDGGKADGTQLK